MISFVYAQEHDGGIGYQNDLPWHLPADLKFFKETTWGHKMVMGRRTFESMDQRILPGRETYVLTTQEDYGSDIEGLNLLHTREDVLELAKDHHLMVIGGAGVFMTLMDDVDQIILTRIDASFPSDTVMPEVDTEKFELVKSVEGVVDEDNKYPHTYEWWQRKQ